MTEGRTEEFDNHLLAKSEPRFVFTARLTAFPLPNEPNFHSFSVKSDVPISSLGSRDGLLLAEWGSLAGSQSTSRRTRCRILSISPVKESWE